KMTVLDEALEKVLQRPGAGRLIDPALVDVSDNVFQHLAGASERHFGVQFSDPHRLPNPFPKVGALVGKVFQPTKQVLEDWFHGILEKLRANASSKSLASGRANSNQCLAALPPL